MLPRKDRPPSALSRPPPSASPPSQYFGRPPPSPSTFSTAAPVLGPPALLPVLLPFSASQCPLLDPLTTVTATTITAQPAKPTAGPKRDTGPKPSVRAPTARNGASSLSSASSSSYSSSSTRSASSFCTSTSTSTPPPPPHSDAALLRELDRLRLRVEHLQSLLAESQATVEVQARENGVLRSALGRLERGEGGRLASRFGDRMLDETSPRGTMKNGSFDGLPLIIPLHVSSSQADRDLDSHLDFESLLSTDPPRPDEAEVEVRVPTPGPSDDPSPIPDPDPAYPDPLLDFSIGSIGTSIIDRALRMELLDDEPHAGDEPPSPRKLFKSDSKTFAVDAGAGTERAGAGWIDMIRKPRRIPSVSSLPHSVISHLNDPTPSPQVELGHIPSPSPLPSASAPRFPTPSAPHSPPPRRDATVLEQERDALEEELVLRYNELRVSEDRFRAELEKRDRELEQLRQQLPTVEKWT
ncbi:hypothetical protein BDK51DRAFT_30404 [Blyttiomyces helicus]|uniref:Uncharacterized protein n=1 Tax=Blyttiomyces helicus TaxID=388810 RepID=A0A4P9WDP6_9FUNG|nr:hypothetical protein BDK51DRAFT_30404 [Blyttiomyces helicus]|eukprot:RKO89080.1 hypothetical protein BDK51DRAFT_30404 [Blyttiomyces helicus]